MVTVDELLTQAHKQLASASFQPPRREVRLLLSSVLGWDEARLMSHGEAAVPTVAVSDFDALLRRRLTGEPIAYLLGEREFYGRGFFVDSRVLIPRPETEHLVEVALEKADQQEPRILDIGTGTGCVAITLAAELPGARVLALDRSIGATAVARRNVIRHSLLERVSLICSDLGTALDEERFDVVVSNPPYVDRNDDGLFSKEVAQFEPAGALFAEDTGMSIIYRLLSELVRLRSGAYLCFEIGAGQDAATSRALQSSPFELLEIREDLAGIPRTVIARRN
jgi:release factor glutamine methyltransferase